jgi:hypothetical protein
MLSLQGKRVLFIAPHFFNYENEIAQEIQKCGGVVDFYDERCGFSALGKILLRLARWLVLPLINQYYHRITNVLNASVYDYVFIVNAEALTYGNLQKIHDRNPHAFYVLYMWDSFKNKRKTARLIPLFDAVYTFDRSDSEKYSLNFLPLFFVNGYSRMPVSDGSSKYDFAFIGTIHSDRFRILSAIKSSLENKYTFYYFMYFPSFMNYLRQLIVDKTTRKAHKSEFAFMPMAKDEVLQRLLDSRIIIDIQHPAQNGLTMRTIEVLAMRKKLVTTNAEIKQYDFYNDQNICIIDRKSPAIPSPFIDSEYKAIPDSVLQHYSISYWLESLFSKSRGK